MVVVTQDPFAEGDRILERDESDSFTTPPIRNNCNRLTYSTNNDLNFENLATNSPDSILQLFSTGVQLRNGSLAKKCVEKLDEILDTNNVLKIYPYLPENRNGNGTFPSAPPISPLRCTPFTPPTADEQITLDWAHALTSDLRHNCLILIDQCADCILRQRDILELSYRDLYDIVERDTLIVSSELLVYNTIYCWGLAELQRLDLDTTRLREVLRDLPYKVRYGLLSKKEFGAWSVRGFQTIPGPTRSKLLFDKDISFIRFHIKERSKGKPAQELPHKMSQERGGIGEKPKILSVRSASQSESEVTNTPPSSNRRGCSYTAVNTWEKCLINFLTCWTAVFD